ncbi:MAG: gliding motility protein GldN [Bacteroides sp.]|nr:gliding motility protein GldN [Bacteroides sp.]MCM1378509.1 gliding motility protein GldN [Bacteroides sp.]MCM1444810.1 gliding motility protein GldN [Prevotella sp.]
MRKSIIFALMALVAAGAFAQEQSSSSSVVSRGPRTSPGQAQTDAAPGVSTRMQQMGSSDASRPESSLKYMRVIYRELDLQKQDANAPLYFPEDLVDGNENLFRIMFRLLAQNKVPAYEYLDGREDFSDNNRVKMADIINRFEILATPAKGFSEKNPVYDVEPVDVPTNEVLAYFIIERWEFDNRTNKMRTTVEAICPVIVRDDSSSLSGKTPMFWMKMADLKPYLQQQYIFTTDDNNLATHTYDDFFTLNMYKGDIYKTRNLRNRTLAQMAQEDPDTLKALQDSIQNRLDHYADNLWVPSREEIAAKREAEAAVADSIAGVKPEPARSKRTRSERASTRSTEKKERPARASKGPKKEKSAPAKASRSATRSVRNRRK